MVSESQFAFLRSIDTPTVCNLMEIVAPERRGSFYTVKHLHCPFPDLPPMVGFAKTVTMRARDKVGGRKLHGKAHGLSRLRRGSAAAGHRRDRGSRRSRRLRRVLGRSPKSNIHKALGCLGTITNGSIRDIPQIAEGFQMLAGSLSPSHAYVHVEDFGIPVTIHGMAVKSGDLIHADQSRRDRRAGQHHRRHEGSRRQACRDRSEDHRRGKIRQRRRSDQGRDAGRLAHDPGSFGARMPARAIAG